MAGLGTKSPSVGSVPLAWRRAVLVIIWAAIGVTTTAVLAPRAAAKLVGAIRLVRGSDNADHLRSECNVLEAAIDSMIIISRAQTVPRSAAGAASVSPADEAVTSGVMLIEYSLLPRTGRSPTEVDHWRLVGTGLPAAWGAFLAGIDRSPTGAAVESGSWSARGWVDRETRGEVVLRVPPRGTP